MDKKKIVFFIVAILFTALMVALTIDMASKTTKPWDRKKNNIIEKYKVK